MYIAANFSGSTCLKNRLVCPGNCRCDTWTCKKVWLEGLKNSAWLNTLPSWNNQRLRDVGRYSISVSFSCEGHCVLFPFPSSLMWETHVMLSKKGEHMHMSPDMAKLSVVRNTKLGDNAFPNKLFPEGKVRQLWLCSFIRMCFVGSHCIWTKSWLLGALLKSCNFNIFYFCHLPRVLVTWACLSWIILKPVVGCGNSEILGEWTALLTVTLGFEVSLSWRPWE